MSMEPGPSTWSEPPDFSQWSTERLRFLHKEYYESLSGIRILYGAQHDEYKLYARWVQALETELDKRPPSA